MLLCSATDNIIAKRKPFVKPFLRKN